jgi:methyl-accepting chemotaxis protein
MLASFQNHARKPEPAARAPAPDLEAVFKTSAFEGSAGAMMTVDRDLKILHVNEATRQLLKTNAAAFRSVWPAFNPDTIVGTCIDMFHKSPAHQRQILSDPGRLPFKTDITIGNLKFALHVTAVFDGQRNYIGNVLQWDDVTAARLNTGMLAALNRSQAVIEFGLDGTILNANDNFLNAMGYRLDDIKGRHHRMFVDPAVTNSPEYAKFWETLRRGEYQAGEYKRIGAGR